MPDDIFAQENSWANELKKTQQNANRWHNIVIEKEKLGLERDISDQKALLQNAIRERNHSDATSILKQIIQTRARQTIITLKEMEQNYGTLSKATVEAQINKYTKDTIKLARAVEDFQDQL